MSTITPASSAHGGPIIDDTATADVTKSTYDETTPDATQPPDSIEQESSVSTTMAEKFYRYKVQMTCAGCSGAVTRVLTRAKDSGAGVNSFSVSLETQSVEVRGPIAFDDLTAKIEKTGKKILEKEEVTEEVTEEVPVAQVEVTAQPVAVA